MNRVIITQENYANFFNFNDSIDSSYTVIDESGNVVDPSNVNVNGGLTFELSGNILFETPGRLCLGRNTVFDGKNYTIDLSNHETNGVFDVCPYLCSANCYETSPFIKNLGILNGRTKIDGGFFVKKNSKFFRVDNCYSTGRLKRGSGGIAGYGSGSKSGKCSITNSYFTGTLTENECGGIVGTYAGFNKGNCIIQNCYSTGTISNFSGGIAGTYAGYSGGCCTIENCYSTGNIITGGGIVGNCPGYKGFCKINMCRSSGNIDHTSGGIASSYAGYYGGVCLIQNCYTTGNISSNGAGIAGGYAGFREGKCIIQNCYSTAKIEDASGNDFTTTGISSTNSAKDGELYISNSYSFGEITDISNNLYVDATVCNGNYYTYDISNGSSITILNRESTSGGYTNEGNKFQIVEGDYPIHIT